MSFWYYFCTLAKCANSEARAGILQLAKIPTMGDPGANLLNFTADHTAVHFSALENMVQTWVKILNLDNFPLVFLKLFLACNSSRQNTHITIFIRLPKHLAIFKYVKSSLNFWSDISRMRDIRVMYNVISQKRKKRRKQYQSEAT